MEEQNRPHLGLKIFWLLILAAGLWLFALSWKKIPSHPPSQTLTAEQAKYDAYLHIKDLILRPATQGQPKGFTLRGLDPYSDNMVTQIGPTRFSCSGFLTVRSPAGVVERERWQCLVSGSQNHWTYQNFRHTPPERITLGKAQPGAIVTGRE